MRALRLSWPDATPPRDRRWILAIAVMLAAGILATLLVGYLSRQAIRSSVKTRVCTLIANTRYTPEDLKSQEQAQGCVLTSPLPRRPYVITMTNSVGVVTTVTAIPQEQLPPGYSTVTATATATGPTATATDRVPQPGPTATVTTTVTRVKPTLPPGAVCVRPVCTPPK